MAATRYAFDVQTAVLPGPFELPLMSNDVPMPMTKGENQGIDMESLEETTRGVLTSLQIAPDPFNVQFFSQGHVDALQRELQRLVRKTLGVQIDRQSDRDLIMIMRSLYMLTREKRIPMARLDDLVVRDALESIKSNLNLHKTYMDTENRMKNVMDWGINTSVRGTNTNYF